ncbi:MAG: heavy-metal-associated domain-containing protein [Steroidobacteraceae bacterium]
MPALAAEARYRIEVVGLACPVCAASMERRLGSIEGVATVRTILEEGTVFVTMKDGATLDKSKLQEVITAAGFSLKTFGTL